MEAVTFSAFEQRAAEAEARLSMLELKLAGAAGGGSTADLTELISLRDMLVAAREATVELQKERDQVVNESAKLKYQVLHLKRALMEADEKVAAAKA